MNYLKLRILFASLIMTYGGVINSDLRILFHSFVLDIAMTQTTLDHKKCYYA